MIASPTAATRLVALLGEPVRHSLSPVFQNAAFQASGVDGVYLALPCSAEALPGLLRGIALTGGAGNVTVPHKALAAAAVDRATDAVRRTGACNTFWAEEGLVWGDNTDVAGFGAALDALLPAPSERQRVLLLGAGGAARAALDLLASRSAEVTLVNRTLPRATKLLERYAGSDAHLRVAASTDELMGDSFDVVVNATSLGLRPGDPLPLAPDRGPDFTAALDLVYSPGGTRWVRAVRERGIPASDGTEMLLHQGAAAFERWWGMPPPLEEMRAALPPR